MKTPLFNDEYQLVNVMTPRDFIQRMNNLGIDTQYKLLLLEKFNQRHIISLGKTSFLLGNKSELVYVPKKNITTINDDTKE